jgi:hypothetical protein
MNDMQTMGAKHNVCKCYHHKVIPVSIILIGVAFLLETLGILTDFALNMIWPVLLIVIGGTKLGARVCKCC